MLHGTVKSRLNYARKSLKTAISQFETDNNVKLYSLSSLPIFFLVFKDLSEVLALAAGTAGAATVAGGAVGGGASVAGGSIGGGAAAAGGTVGGGAVAGNAGAAVSGVGAAAAGSAGGVGAIGFLGTVAGKVAIAAAVVFLGGAAAFAVTLSLRNEPSDGNAVKQEYVEPSTIINDPEVDCIIEDIEVEPGSNLNSGIKYSYYDVEGNLLLYQVYEWTVIEEYGEEEIISSSYYYADGTPWDIREYSNYDYGDYPQYGWYGVETYTENNVRYYPDGTIYTHTSYEYANRHEVRENYYNADGSLRSYGIYEYAEVADNRWERIKGTRYNPDGSVRAYNTFEYDENGELKRDNFYNADGDLQYYYISVYDETGVRQEGYNPDGTPRN